MKYQLYWRTVPLYHWLKYLQRIQNLEIMILSNIENLIIQRRKFFIIIFIFLIMQHDSFLINLIALKLSKACEIDSIAILKQSFSKNCKSCIVGDRTNRNLKSIIAIFKNCIPQKKTSNQNSK